MLCFIVVSCNFLFSQNKQILYGFSDVPQSLLLNPAKQLDNDWYFGIPLLSHIHAKVGITGSTVYDIFADDNVNFNTKIRNAVDNMGSNDFYSVNQQLEIFSGGFSLGSSYEKDKYISFGLYQELDFIFYFPKDLAILALEGNQNNINRPFRTNQVRLAAEALSVWHVGYSKKLNDKLTVGLRGKIYSSLANVNSTKNKGRFVTVPGQSNFYDHIFDVDLEARTSGIANLDGDNVDPGREMIRRVFFGGNLGLGFDVGFTHKINKQWTFDGSLLDVGFIRHTKGIENHEIKGNYTFEGINPLFPNSGSGQSAEDYWNEIEENFEGLFEVDSTTTKYTTWRPVKLNTSLNYAFGKETFEECNCTQDEGQYLNRAGLQLFAMTRPNKPIMALTAYYYRRLFDNLQVKATYTVDSFSAYNIGLGMSANLGGLNFYVMADNFLQLENIYDTQSVSLQLGFNYIFKKKDED